MKKIISIVLIFLCISNVDVFASSVQMVTKLTATKTTISIGESVSFTAQTRNANYVVFYVNNKKAKVVESYGNTAKYKHSDFNLPGEYIIAAYPSLYSGTIMNKYDYRTVSIKVKSETALPTSNFIEPAENIIVPIFEDLDFKWNKPDVEVDDVSYQFDLYNKLNLEKSLCSKKISSESYTVDGDLLSAGDYRVTLYAMSNFYPNSETISIDFTVSEKVIKYSGTCGNNLTWTLDYGGTLCIKGNGDMNTYVSEKDFPWYKYISEIKNVEIYAGVTSVFDYAFYEYPNLKTATIGINSTTANKSTMVLGNDVFSGCENLTTVNITNSVKSLGYDVFEDCVNLTSINLGNGLLTIGDNAFNGCEKLTAISIPDSVTTIGEKVFYSCKSLSYVYIGRNLTSIPERTFRSNTSLFNITIPSNIKSIGEGAFYGCTNLTNIIIPESVSLIGVAPFEECTKLQDINVDSKNQHYMSENGILFDKNKTRLIQYPSGKQGDYVIPESVITIGESAFDNCDGLINLQLNDSLKYIEADAFVGCNSIKSLIIPDSVLSIGENAFYYCNSIDYIKIGNQITAISNETFDECECAKSIIVGYNVSSIGKDAFRQCYALESIVIPPSVTSIADYAFREGSTTFKVKGQSGSYAETYAKANNLTFEALDTYTITYNANGGNNAPLQQVKFNNIDNNIPNIVPNKTDYSFVGWSTKLNSTTAEYFLGDSISVNANTILYAVWSPLYPESITPSMRNVNLFVGDSEQVNVSIEPENVPNKKIIWTSNNPNIATVNNGLITAISPGNTTIIATSENNKTATITVSVMEIRNNIDFSLSEMNNSLSKSEIRIAIDGLITDISSLKWAYDSQTEDYFETNGTAVDINNLSVPVNKNGIYTVYLKDIYGEKTTKTINVSKIAIEQSFFENTSGYLEQENNLVLPIDFDFVNENITIYMALYDNGKLKTIEQTVCSPMDYIGEKEFKKSFNIMYPRAGYELKAFVWNENTMPFTNVIGLKAKEAGFELVIDGNTDKNSYEFTVPESGEYTITTYTDLSGQQLDLYGYLYEGDNYITESSDIGNGNYNFSITANLTAGKTYTLIVINERETNGDYLIVVN